ncbi:C2 calcium-dependent domain-containing protein 4C-like isoform X1 [Lepidochelys kempii]|uniref:C2 calcium-dependent domain-containing protein 4C-like isoform X1 n=1 Tax=Lepidochelys kempii TaxID=8472 RepID=UPI003C6EB5D8
MWCLEKLSKASEPIMLGKEGVCYWNRAQRAMAASPNILTPDRIPEFCIPSRLISFHSARDPSSRIQSYAETNLCPRETVHNPSTQLPRILSTEIANNFISVEESTNSDPQSQAALSLIHFPKVQTSYGFCTLLESPHTRRKESIFHNDPCSCSMSCLLLLPSSRIYLKGVDSSIISSTTTRLSSRHPHMPRQDTCDCDTASSTDSSPFTSSLLKRFLPRSCFLFTIQSPERLLCRTLKAESKSSMLRGNSLSTDEDSSTDSSPNPNRRSLASLCECSSIQSSSGSQSTIFPQDFTNGRERLRSVRTVFLDRRGILRLFSDYCPESRRLRLRLISAEGLYDIFVEPKRINCCVTFSLVPGKVQKQRSTVIKRSRNPIFNEDFFFDGISKDDLHRRSIKIKAVNKASTMKKDYILGKIELCLLSMVPI